MADQDAFERNTMRKRLFDSQGAVCVSHSVRGQQVQRLAAQPMAAFRSGMAEKGPNLIVLARVDLAAAKAKLIARGFWFRRERGRVHVGSALRLPVLGHEFVDDGFEGRLPRLLVLAEAGSNPLGKPTRVQKLSSPSRCLPTARQPGTLTTWSLYRRRT